MRALSEQGCGIGRAHAAAGAAVPEALHHLLRLAPAHCAVMRLVFIPRDLSAPLRAVQASCKESKAP